MEDEKLILSAFSIDRQLFHFDRVLELEIIRL